MLVLRQGLLELPHHKIINPKCYEGLHHAWKAAIDAAPESSGIFRETDAYLHALSNTPEETLTAYKHSFDKLLQQVNLIKDNAAISNHAEALRWLKKLEEQIADAQFSASLLTPWIDLLPVPAGLDELNILDNIPSLINIRDFEHNLLPLIGQLMTEHAEHREWLQKLEAAIRSAHSHALEKLSKIEKLTNECAGFAEVEYGFLYDEEKHLFHIGYNVSEDIKDKSYYDILASEARLGILQPLRRAKCHRIAGLYWAG
ncbi:hypothetical protein LWM68_00255 [Niabella sp. W65]|nr:hypothetical protein [Niabella sp. W65]MCH7361354.1 hypothetical protein [Niabella sp. W65]ULT45167.1 hypothetical protein KRR40_18835 [Niabella sp. I65]